MVWFNVWIKSFIKVNYMYIVFISICVFVCVYCIKYKGFYHKYKKEENQNKWFVVYCGILAVYMAILFEKMLLNREIGEKYQIQLIPFWSYRYLDFNDSISLIVQIIYNVLIFIPWPILWGNVFSTMRRFRWAVGSALLFSVFVEVTQLVFKLGLFEFDDMFHNTLGAVIGYSILKLYKMHKQKGIEE